MTPTHRFNPVLALIAAALLGFPPLADAAGFPHPIHSVTRPHVRACPHCHHACRLEAKLGEEKKECFDVESEFVCIPRVVFPWQKRKGDPCVHNGARLRRVCVLKTETYTCPKCEYSWAAAACTAEASAAGGLMIGGCDLDGEVEVEPTDGDGSAAAAGHAPVWVDLTRFPHDA